MELIEVGELAKLIEIKINKTAGCGKVGRASRIDRVGKTRRKRNRSVTINRIGIEEVGIIETEAVGVIETTSKRW